MRPRTAALVTAAGSSVRMGGLKKEYRPMPADPGRTGRTVLGAAVSAFADPAIIDLIVVVIPPGQEAAARAALPPELFAPAARPRIEMAIGGSDRQASVRAGLEALAEAAPDWVLIHDGARPWLSRDLLVGVLAAVRARGAVIPALPLTETPKEIDASGLIVRHMVRAGVVAAQTPQAFPYPEIRRAHALAGGDGRTYTDDAEIWAAYIGPVAVVAGDPANRKITFPEDLA